MKKKLSCILLVFFIVFLNDAHPVTKGSEIVVSVEPFVNFPIVDLPGIDSDNKMLGFGWFKNGFSLQDATTTCTFDSQFPVAGNVSLNGGLLYLNTDLLFHNVTNFNSSGIFLGNKHVIDFSESVTGLPSSYNSVFHTTKVFLNSDFLLSGTVKFKGDCSIDGRGNRIVFGADGHIIVDKGSTLRLRNLELNGISGDAIWCVDDSCKLELDNMRWVQDGGYSFTNGSIKLLNEVNFAGPYTFYYQSTMTSTIDADSCWYLSDIATLSMGRKMGIYGREPLYFTDASSQIRMENSTFSVTSSGMRLTRGTFFGDGEVTFDMSGTGSTAGLILGDGTADNDFRFKLYPEAAFHLAKGPLVYDIVSAENFLSGEVTIKFIRQATNSAFYVNYNIPFENVTIKTTLQSATVVQNGKILTFKNCLIDASSFEYLITGTRKNSYTQVLDQDDNVFLVKGEFPFYLEVRKTGNSLAGRGDVGGPIILHDSSTDLTIDMLGLIKQPIVMNGGKIFLTKDLYLGNDVQLTGSGYVSTTSYNIHLPFKDLVWTGTMQWQVTGNGSLLQLNANLDLFSTMTFSGNWLLVGNGNTLNIHDTGNIVVDKNSQVLFRNIQLTGNSGNKLRCFDDSSTIVFDNVVVGMDGDYSFTTGSLSFLRAVDIRGTSTFFYQSSLTSTIQQNSTVHVMSGTCLSLGRKEVAGREPLYFTDKTSELIFDNASWSVTGAGMSLTRGTIILNSDVYVDMQSTSSATGVSVGSGNFADDVVIQWNSGASLRMPRGHFSYNNTTPYGLQSKTKNARIIVGQDFHSYLNDDVLYENISIETNALWELVIKAGKRLSYKNFKVIFPGSEYDITGKFFGAGIYLLDGNGLITISTGVLPLATVVTGVSNTIQGFGHVAGPLIVQSGAELTLSSFGNILTDVTMGGGKIIVGTMMNMGPGKVMTGLGTVNQSNKLVLLNGQDKTWTGTTIWDGSGGIIVFFSGMKLSSTWTFSGQCIVDGNGYPLDLGLTGQLVVERGSSVTFKNILLDNVAGNRMRCTDDAGKIVLNEATIVQDSDITFGAGSLEFVNKCSLVGTSTFAYQSSGQSVVKPYSQLFCDEGMQFSYQPPTSSRTLFSLTDNTSKLVLNSATLHSTSTGLQLTKGVLEVKGLCSLASDALYKAQGVILGDGVSATNSLNIDVFPESTLKLLSGFVVYKNVS